MESIPTKPLDEFLMAIAGPAVSLALGTTCILGGHYLPFRPVLGGINIVQLLGFINIGLVIFNMLPSFPMDGGRVLRALLAMRLEYTRATQIAAHVGQALALLFGLVGLLWNPFQYISTCLTVAPAGTSKLIT